ncbi:MAG: hypothetical protein A2633_02985 [Candidatus Sungbacteria bacterium RIFCSPHIGHO2_01_FULL_47_32]|uniref:Uncharacterized protein n=1 Tax=Candidatus Sungbacteria bacterium RIFCSPHIGHO2_01_FULL_47_32 TaxID=1802264 RepID=A0A1G2K7A7_9BACT|nr:MAG: hypothetical protein A2633_02985 [Candidatus Sungbacteria bacterium RIFCSPHIGHO2_01_FULL_47_32]OGZ99377.1 MAG: hypothetical protein A3D57_00775 [Candidatus Sungbacteria bacterium RIFCSPHIGHO2_02_FULL_46_12]
MLGLLGFVLLVVGAILTFFVSRLVGYAVLCVGSLLSAFGDFASENTFLGIIMLCFACYWAVLAYKEL